jgi:N-acetylglucosaminyldiphosphoundecaprenol N-acetyl-beta-D-mannosaminyltransferase
MGPEDFDRPLHMILGLPFDAVGMQDVIARLRAVPESRERCFISTPNLNFLIAARSDPDFRQSVFDSDLSLADGMPIIWIARLLRIPLPERVPGSGLMETLRRAPPDTGKPLRVFFFGGEPGMGEKACRALKAAAGGMTCVGAIDPGYGSAAALSKPAHIDAINTARPDFLIVSLGAKKGQEWIVANLPMLEVPTVAHLGAVMKFIAGDVARAPGWLQSLGLEWMWRIREEPALWRRYVGDGCAFIDLLCTRVLPLVLWNRFRAPRTREIPRDVVAVERRQAGRRLVRLTGSLSGESIDAIREAFRELARARAPADLDFSAVRHIDSAFLGQLHLLRSLSRSEGFELRLLAMPARIRKIIGWYLCDHVLE